MALVLSLAGISGDQVHGGSSASRFSSWPPPTSTLADRASRGCSLSDRFSWRERCTLSCERTANRSTLQSCLMQIVRRQKSPPTSRKMDHLRQNDFGETRQSVDVEAEQIRTASGEIVPVCSGIRLNIYGPRTDSDRSLLQLRKMQGESSIMASACASRPSSGRHATFETLGPSTIAHTWPITALRRWARPSLRTSNSSPDSRATR